MKETGKERERRETGKERERRETGKRREVKKDEDEKNVCSVFSYHRHMHRVVRIFNRCLTTFGRSKLRRRRKN